MGLTNITDGNITNNCIIIDHHSSLEDFLMSHTIGYSPQNANCGGQIRVTLTPDMCSGVTEIPENECVALVDLFNSTDGSNRNNKENR